MMKESVQEFIDREVWPHKERFEKKDYEFTKLCMQKAGELGFTGVSPFPKTMEEWAWALYPQCWFVITFQAQPDLFQQLLEPTRALELCQSFSMELRNKSRSMFPSWQVENGLVPTALPSPAQGRMPTLEKQKQCSAKMEAIT